MYDIVRLHVGTTITVPVVVPCTPYSQCTNRVFQRLAMDMG